MEKTVMAAASFEKQKYYIAPEFSELPEGIKAEVQTVCVVIAQKLMCTFVMGFYSDGDIYFDIVKSEDAIDFDDIGAELEIKEIRRQKSELLKALKIWYLIYKTPDGEKVKEELLKTGKVEL